MQNAIQFQIFKEDGAYTASGVNVAIVTDGKTLDELQANIKEAVELHFQDEDMEALGFNPASSIVTIFKTPAKH